jgi:hypothetical protein
MGMVKTIFLVVLMLSASAFAVEREDDPILIHRLIVLPDSQLTIDGRTNVNPFKCYIPQYVGRDTLVLQESGGGAKPVFVKGSVSLDASSFDCGMAMMTSDFCKTIKSQSYPAIIIEFLMFERAPTYSTKEEKFKGVLNISLGGATNIFEVDCTIERMSSGHIRLKGSRDFKFSDFRLEPPTRMFGLVRVEDSLKVSFNLVLELDGNA